MSKRFVALFVGCFTLAAVFGQNAKNPYHLPLVNTIEAYIAQLQQDDDNRMLNLEVLIPDLVLDIRYATTDNFTGMQVYEYPAAWLRKPAAKALAAVQKALDSIGLGLVVYDAYRPYAATLKFFEIYPDERFLANPAKGSKHNRGAAVDVGLVNKSTRSLLEMPTPYDHFGPEAFPTCQNTTAEAKANRDLLINVMKRYGFEVLSSEWWHYDFVDWQRFGLLDLNFRQLRKANKNAGLSSNPEKEISN